MNSTEVQFAHMQVQVPPSRTLRIVAFSIFLLFAAAAIAMPIIFGSVWLQMVMGRRELDLLVILGTPVFCAFLLILALHTYRGFVRTRNPDLYLPDHFEIWGISYDWGSVSHLYLNPSLKYMALLFRGLEGPSRIAGITILKSSIVPSTDAFVALVKSKNIVIETSKKLLVQELWEIRHRRQRGIS